MFSRNGSENNVDGDLILEWITGRNYWKKTLIDYYAKIGGTT